MQVRAHEGEQRSREEERKKEVSLERTPSRLKEKRSPNRACGIARLIKKKRLYALVSTEKAGRRHVCKLIVADYLGSRIVRCWEG